MGPYGATAKRWIIVGTQCLLLNVKNNLKKMRMLRNALLAVTTGCMWLCMSCSDSGPGVDDKDKPHRPDIETQVIAHRGYWDKAGSAQNSIASLKAAQELGVYGSEFDVNMTSDNRLVVVHGPAHGNLADVRTATFDEVRAVTLSNGEPTPTFEEYLEQGAKSENVKLICEIKDHATSKRETEVVEAVLDAVEKAGMQDRIEYIAFSKHVCAELVRLCPDAKVAYLNGDLSPAELKEMGLTGLDYQKSKMEGNPSWLREARSLGLTVNIWTLNSDSDMEWAVVRGVDYVTTDDPLQLQYIIEQNRPK